MIESPVLSHRQAETFYDRFGAKQDSQGFYEDVALDELVAHADFSNCSSVLELGCGTGRFAERLLDTVLPAEASYLGLDVSETMVEIAQRRLERFGERVQVRKTDGSMRFPLGSGTIDRVVSTYVADLLSEEDLRSFIAESHRVLRTGGRLCVAGLTHGNSRLAKIVSSLWSRIHRVWPAVVGGCRPLDFASRLDRRFHIVHRVIVSRRGIPSEVLVAERR